MTATPLYWITGGQTTNWSDKNWSTSPTGPANCYWTDGDQAVFGGTIGDGVTLDTNVTVDSMQFTADGYALSASDRSFSITVSGANTVDVSSGCTATISAALSCNSGMEKLSEGLFSMGGKCSGTGAVQITGGKLQVTGAMSNPVTIEPGGTLEGAGDDASGAMTGPVTNNGGIYAADLYHIEIVAGFDQPINGTDSGTLSYSDGQGEWTYALSAEDAAWRVLTGTANGGGLLLHQLPGSEAQSFGRCHKCQRLGTVAILRHSDSRSKQ
jgi:hypothetical protein